MGDALRTARARWSRDDLDDATHKLRWFGTILLGLSAYVFYGGPRADRARRTRQLIFTSEDMRQALNQWERFWFLPRFPVWRRR